MRRPTILLLALATALVALLAAAPAGMAAKGSTASKPKITRVTPMRVTLGERLTIRGRHFKGARRGNTVIFQGTGGRTAFVKPLRATSRKLVVKVPASVSRLLKVNDSGQRPTRLRLRVLAGRFSEFTPRRLSPVVLGVGTEGPGRGPGGKPLAVCKKDSDHDDDLLTNARELEIGTDPCLEDTDDDGATDGWEYYAAKDLNLKAVPFPDKRPFPNALDPSDDEIDFDGDGLRSDEEYRAWRVTGSSFDASKVGGGPDSPLGYSDGTQTSRGTEVPGVPGWTGPSHGLGVPAQPFPATYDLHGDPLWRDDERDADRDGLSNWLESARGPGRPAWWTSFYAVEAHKADPWPKVIESCGQAPGAFNERPFAELDLADKDIDGDTLLDGEDDQDADDYSNIAELYEVVNDVDGDGQAACGYTDVPTFELGGQSRLLNGFNPCAPDPDSRTCPFFGPM